MLVLVAVAAAGPMPQASLAQETAAIQQAVPRVSDPIPAPGSVLAAGPHVVAARVDGAAPSAVQWLVDGQPVSGPFADPDGQLSDRRGREISLGPGTHLLGVSVEPHGVLRQWPVLVTDLTIDLADANLVGLGVRMSGRRAGSRPILLVNPADPAAALTAGPLAVATDALMLPTDRSRVPDSTIEAIAQANLADDAEVFVLGGQDVVGEVVVTALRDRGHVATRIGAGDPRAIAAATAEVIADRVQPDADAAVVVAPDEPASAALRGSLTAASTGAALLLVGPAGPTAAAEAALQRFSTALLSTDLSALQRDRVVAAMRPDAISSDDAMAPRRAGEVIIVTADLDAGESTSTEIDQAVAVFAGRGADVNRAVVLGSDAGRDYVARYRPTRVILVQGPDDEGREPQTLANLSSQLQLEWANGVDAPTVEVLVDPTAGLSVTFTADQPLRAADVHVDLVGYEWSGEVTVDQQQAVWQAASRPRLPEPLEPAAPGTAVPVDVTALIAGPAGTRHLSARTTALIDPLTSVSREGWLVAGGSSRVVGRGPLRTFTIEVERATGLDLQAVTDEAEAILLDPRGWTADGTRSLQRIGNSRVADLRVVVARPSTVDLYCGRAGLRTGGRVSCWDGYRALLNLDRWNTGVVPFHSDLVVYRQYLVNHEFGHGLGYGHEFCPGPGRIAPVMQQQTGGIGSCQANGWPYPTVGDIVAVG